MGALLGHRGLLLGGADPDAVIHAAFAGGEDGIWIAPRLGGMYQDTALTVPWAADGDLVAGYVDRSPNGHVGTQATSAARPPGYSNRLAGDGVDNHLDFGDILDLHTGSQFVVVVARYATSGAGTLVAKSSTSGVDGRYATGRTSDSVLDTFIDNGLTDTASVADTDTTLRVISAIHNRASGLITLRTNGVVRATKSFAPTGTDLDTGYPYLIMSYNGVSRFLNGDFHESVQVQRVPVAGELEAIEQRLAAVHGVTL